MPFFPNPNDIEGIITLVEFFGEEERSYNDVVDLLSWKRIPELSFKASLELELVIFLGDDVYKLSRTQKLVEISNKIKSRRNLLFEFATNHMPFFAALENCGPRSENRALGKERNVAQMLLWAQLRTPLDEGARLWWRGFRSKLIKERSSDTEELEERGWIGEELSIAYEAERLGSDAGIEQVSNLDGPNAGYDILSWVKSDSEERKRIEVKASKFDVNQASIFISWNEWSTANHYGCHEFHLWPNIENPAESPIVIDVAQVSDIIPELKFKETRWKTFVIPMRLLVTRD